MRYTVTIRFIDDAGNIFNEVFSSDQYQDIRNCILDAQVWINKKVCYEPMEPQAFRDYSKKRNPCTNWKHEEAGAGEG